MRLMTAVLTMTFFVALSVAQEAPGKMGAKPEQKPVTTPPSEQRPETTPTTPQPRQPSQPQPEVNKPEASAPPSAAPVPKREPVLRQPAGPALSMNTPAAADLQKRIEAALQRDPTLSGASITVNVTDDAIDISGNANTNKERLAARRIVQSFAANRRVRERITVAGVQSPETPQPVATETPGVPQAQRPRGEEPEPPPDQNLNKPETKPEQHGDKSDRPR
jgi:hypothetical protein